MYKILQPPLLQATGLEADDDVRSSGVWPELSAESVMTNETLRCADIRRHVMRLLNSLSYNDRLNMALNAIAPGSFIASAFSRLCLL